jgi:2-keto-4-pentenoate hydratase
LTFRFDEDLIFRPSWLMEKTSAFLYDLWMRQLRCAGLPDKLAPQSREEAYAIQALLEKQSNKPLPAWKIAATSVAGQKHIGVTGPLAGRYIAERVVRSGGIIPFGNNHMKVAEVEFAFRFGESIAPRKIPYTEDEVIETVSHMHPAIEVPDSRYDHFELVGGLALIVDNACADWLCIGEAAPDLWRTLDLAAFAPIGRVNDKPDVGGKGSNVLGSPRTALTWFVNEMTSLGVTLKAGQVVSTGTCLIPMPIDSGDHITGDFGPLGRVEVTLGP